MPGFGAKLRREREERGFTLDQIADATRINPRYLKALEADELAKLPGSVFNKGYVRAYAGFIGADAERLVRAYTEEEQAQQSAGKIHQTDVIEGMAEAARAREGSKGAGPGRTALRIGLPALAVVILVVLGGWGWLHRSGAPEAPGDEALPAVARGGEARPVETGSAAEPAGAGSAEAGTPEAGSMKPSATRADPEPAATAEGGDARPTERPGREETPAEVRARPPADRAPATGQAAPVPGEPEPATATSSPAEARAGRSSAPAPQPVATEGELRISEYGVGTGVVDRRLVGRSDRFEPGTRVWFWTRVLGGHKGETIRHVWLHEGRAITSTELKLGGPHWRTQSRKTLHAGSEGNWTVEARDASGRVLARSEFTCGPG